MTTSISATIVGPKIPTQSSVSGPSSLTSGIVGGIGIGLVGVLGSKTALKTDWKKALLIGAGIALVGGIAAAIIGPRLINHESDNGTQVGTAYGRKTVQNSDGTSKWAQTTAPLILGHSVGAADGYATLVQATAATRPNTGTDELAYIRDGESVKTFTLKAPQLEAVEAFIATDPTVVAYTTRLSEKLYAGPAATSAEKTKAHLSESKPAPF